ncbi:MAG: cyclic nucleotide-binding domain-containing protein [Desulfobacterales bacterium]|nr:cyclic nucleotide-binding domain-containing protein [Desulfobacterales bacterium]
MNSPEVIFKIITENNCPYYMPGDEFKLCDNAFSLPHKPACVSLFMDMLEVSLNIEKHEKANPGTDMPGNSNCSGCKGTVAFEYKKREKKLSEREYEEISAASGLLNNFSFFQTLGEHDINNIVPLLKVKKYSEGDIIIKEGDPGANLYIILVGRAEAIVDDGTNIGFMERGEVFGEISLITNARATATIRVSEPSTIIYLEGKDFKNILRRFTSIQMYFARLLAERLAKTNVERLEEFSSGMIGKLSENPPSELLQTFNLNHKTGVLSLTLPNGLAEVIFREGTLLSAVFGEKQGDEAFFEILKQKEGRFKFNAGLPPEKSNESELGDFMWLLMEGLNRIDESHATRES